eukprot:145153_1
MTDVNDAMFPICVKFVTEKEVLIIAEPTDTIRNIKQKIQDKDGIPIHYQKLKYGEQYLNNSKPLSYYGLSSYSTVYLFTNLAGGASKCYNCSLCTMRCLSTIVCCPCVCYYCLGNNEEAYGRLCYTMPTNCLEICSCCCEKPSSNHLPDQLINSWSEYRRMFHCIGWINFKFKPNEITDEGHKYGLLQSKMYGILMAVYKETDNTPSIIRHRDELMLILEDYQWGYAFDMCKYVESNTNDAGVRWVKESYDAYNAEANDESNVTEQENIDSALLKDKSTKSVNYTESH